MLIVKFLLRELLIIGLIFLPDHLTLLINLLLLNIKLPAAEDVVNCDLFQRGSVSGEIKNESLFLGAVTRGAACTHTSLNNISTKSEGLLQISGQNYSGRSLKTYLYNEGSNRTDLEILETEGAFNDFYSLLSWPKLESSSYSLNFENRSFGNEESSNELKNVNYYPIPLAWLSQIHINGPQTIKNDIKVLNTYKFGTWYYQVDIKGNGILALSQGYDPGWLAFNFNLNKFQLSIFDHVKLNNWSNAWIIPENKNNLVTDSATNLNIIIFYWPQLLEYFGFLLLVISVVYLTRGLSKD